MTLHIWGYNFVYDDRGDFTQVFPVLSEIKASALLGFFAVPATGLALAAHANTPTDDLAWAARAVE